MNSINREAWLQAAVANLRPLFLGHGWTLPEIHVSVGWPSSGGLGKSKRTLGQCWFGTSSEDGKPHLFISPMLALPLDPMGVLPTLVHELAHVVAGVEAKHGPKFAKVVEKLGLEGKATSTFAGEDLLARLAGIVEALGPFPHSAIVPQPKEKTQTTRMKKAECNCCGYTVRLARKWADLGVPDCPIDKKPLTMEARMGDE